MAIAIPVSFDLNDISERIRAARPRRVALLLVGLWMANAFDAWITTVAHGQGVLHELNPLANHIITFDPWLILPFKVGLVIIGSYILWQHRTQRVTELGAWVAMTAYAVVCMHWHNCYVNFLENDFSALLSLMHTVST